VTGRGPLRLLAATVGALVVLTGCGDAAQGPAATAPPDQPAPAVSPPVVGDAVVADPVRVPAPTAVEIPAIGVASPLLDLGVTADGTAEVPDRYELAGWFEGGGRPGARGPTVLLGHVDSTTGPAVFYDLRALRPGDLVEVTVADGTVARYAVTGTERFAKDALPTAAVFGATTDDVLRLVTCTGEFDRGAGSYTDNLVVTAERTG
jgi:LPXTG-site transpeptidase (sortase) family protein